LSYERVALRAVEDSTAGVARNANRAGPEQMSGVSAGQPAADSSPKTSARNTCSACHERRSARSWYCAPWSGASVPGTANACIAPA